MSAPKTFIKIEIALAKPDEQFIETLQMVAGSSVNDALAKSELVQTHQLDITTIDVGIFSKIVSQDAQLRDGDRIEIYRDLTIDPKTRRALLAAKKLKSKS